MANREETYSPEFHSVFVETNLDTHIVILAHIHDTIPDFKDKFYKEHKQFYPEIGEISISSLKVKRRGIVYRLPDSNNINKVFEGFRSTNWFLQADLVRVENRELLAIMAPEQNEIGNGSVLVDGNTKCLALEYGLESKVVEKKTKKRKMESLDGKRSRKKSKISFDQSAVATTSGRDVVDESGELSGKVLDAVAMTDSLAVSSRDKVDDIFAGAVVKDIENEKNGISMVENQQSSDVDMQCQEKTMTMNPELVQANQTVKEALDGSQISCGKVPSKKLDDFTGAIEQDLEMGEKSADLVMIGQEKELAPTLEHVDAHITSRDDVTESHEACAEVQVGVAPEHCDTLSREKLDDLLPGAIQKDTGRGEGSSFAPGAADNLQTTELVTYQENQLEGSSGLTTGPATEKKRKRKKSSKDDINQSAAAAASKTSRKIVNEISGVPENVMVEKPVEDVGRDNIETDNLVSYPANHLEANIGLTIAPVSEKKRKRKKSSKDDISQSIAAATSTSREIVNDLDGVTGNVDRVNATSESLAVSERENLGNPLAEAMQKENEMGDKIDDDEGIGRAIPSATENIQTDNFVSNPENQLEASSGLITGATTEKKKRRKKSSKDHVNQSTAAATTLSKEIVNEREKVFGSIDHVGATCEVFPNLGGEKIVNAHIETIQDENEMGDKIVDKVGSIEATPSDTDEIQAEDNVQVADLATALPTDHIGKITDDRRTLEHEVAKDNGEIDAGEAKSVKSTKKKKSRKTKTPNGADEIQAEDNIQVAALATTLPTLVQESKTLDHIGKFTDDKRTLEVEVAKDNGEIDADVAKSVKSTEKKKSRNNKTPAKEDTLVDSGPHIVEPFKVVDEEGPDNVIRNVLDSLHQGNESQENLDKIEKKASKRSKKKLSLNIAESQVLPVEVNNAAQEAVPQINNPEDTDASWTSVKKYTQIDVADNNLSQQTQIEKANMADNFGSRQKDDIVVGGGKKQDKVPRVAKSKKEKRGLDLHPSGSIDGSLSSMKRKERNSKAQPASSGTSQLKSRLKNDRSAPKKVDDSITSVKKSSNSLTVNKYKLNFFKDAEMWNSSEDESDKRTSLNFSTKTPPDSSNVSTKTPSDNSSDDDSDVTSMSRKQGNNLAGGTFKYAGSLKDIVRSSQSYKKAKVSASQYMSDDDESPGIDVVPDSQAI